MVRLNPPCLPAFLLWAVVALNSPLCAQEMEAPTAEEIQAAESAPLFTSHEVLEITLEADFHIGTPREHFPRIAELVPPESAPARRRVYAPRPVMSSRRPLPAPR